MAISDAVRILADLLARHLAGEDGNDVLVEWLHKMASIPDFAQQRRLDLWDELLQDHDMDWEAQEARPEFALADEVRELGRHNLYGAIKPEKTRGVYEHACEMLRDAGVRDLPPASAFDFSRW